MSRVKLAGTVIAALLVVGFPAMTAAQNEGGPQIGGPEAGYVPVPMVTVTGMLKSDGADGWILVDQASGDEIALKKKSKKLAKHDGAMVTLEGRWKDNDPSMKIFKVSKVEAAPAEAAIQTTPATEPTTTEPTTTEPTTPESTESPAPEAAPESPESPAPEAAPEDVPESPESPAAEPETPTPQQP